MKRKISLLLSVLLVFAFTQVLASAETQITVDQIDPKAVFSAWSDLQIDALTEEEKDAILDAINLMLIENPDLKIEVVCNMIIYSHFNICVGHNIRHLVGTPAFFCLFERYAVTQCIAHPLCDNSEEIYLGRFEGILPSHQAGGVVVN